MSTITVVKINGYASIAADSLTTWGTEKESAEYVVNHSKIVRVSESFLGISGGASAKLMIRDYFSKNNAKGKLKDADSIFRAWIQLHQALKDDYFLNPQEDTEDSVESTRMDVLIANPYGIFGVSSHRAVQEFSKFFAYGTGAEYAMGAMYLAYSSKNDAEEIAILGVQAAAEFDSKTSLPVVVHKVKLQSSSKALIKT